MKVILNKFNFKLKGATSMEELSYLFNKTIRNNKNFNK